MAELTNTCSPDIVHCLFTLRYDMIQLCSLTFYSKRSIPFTENWTVTDANYNRLILMIYADQLTVII